MEMSKWRNSRKIAKWNNMGHSQKMDPFGAILQKKNAVFNLNKRDSLEKIRSRTNRVAIFAGALFNKFRE